MPTTTRLMAQLAASPRKSSASACRAADPAATPAVISTANIVALMANTARRIRRYAGSPRCGSSSWP